MKNAEIDIAKMSQKLTTDSDGKLIVRKNDGLAAIKEL